MAIKNTLELFNLDRIDRDVFQWKGQNFGWQRIYGGQVMAQCLIAANHTVKAPHQAHSFHSYFLRPGIMEESILFDVDRSFMFLNFCFISCFHPIFFSN